MTIPETPSTQGEMLKKVDSDATQKPVPRSERLRILNEEHGMTAHSPEEINDMYYLTQPKYGYHDARDYVGMIARSNGKVAYQRPLDVYDEMTRRVFHPLTLAYQLGLTFKDPVAKAEAQAAANKAGIEAARHAMTGVTENFLDRLNDAHETTDALYRFDESLSAENIDQNMKFGELDIEAEMQDNPDLQHAIGAVTRYVEGFLFSQNVGEDYTRTDYMSDDPEVIKRMVETVGEIDVRFLREIVKTVRELELARKNFWTVELIGRPADDETGAPARKGVNSINDPALQQYVANSLGEIYRGVYKSEDQIEQ